MSKVLVVYFSRAGQNYTTHGLQNLQKGNTEIVAEKIAKFLGADLFKLETERSYSTEYYACCDEAKEEQNNDARPALKSVPDISSFDTIILGYPNWWGTMPMAVWTFLDSVDTSGKTIYPFCTNEGSGMGRSASDLAKLAPSANIQKGLAIIGSHANEADEMIKNWLKDLA